MFQKFLILTKRGSIMASLKACRHTSDFKSIKQCSFYHSQSMFHLHGYTLLQKSSFFSIFALYTCTIRTTRFSHSKFTKTTLLVAVTSLLTKKLRCFHKREVYRQRMLSASIYPGSTDALNLNLIKQYFFLKFFNIFYC